MTNSDNYKQQFFKYFMTCCEYETYQGYIQGWVKVIGLFMFQLELATNRIISDPAWNFWDVLPMF